MSIIGNFQAEMFVKWDAINWQAYGIDASKQVYKWGDVVPYLDPNNKVTNVEWYRIGVTPTGITRSTQGRRGRFDYDVSVYVEAYIPPDGSDQSREWEMIEVLSPLFLENPHSSILKNVQLQTDSPDNVIDFIAGYTLNG